MHVRLIVDSKWPLGVMDGVCPVMYCPGDVVACCHPVSHWVRSGVESSTPVDGRTDVWEWYDFPSQHYLQESDLPVILDTVVDLDLHHSSTIACDSCVFTPPLGHYNAIMYSMNIYHRTFTWRPGSLVIYVWVTATKHLPPPKHCLFKSPLDTAWLPAA